MMRVGIDEDQAFRVRGGGVMAITKADFQKLADVRIREAKILLDAGEWDGAYYLAGYAVECAMKACIIKRLNTSDAWPEKRFTEDCYKHDLELLLRLADLETAMKAAGPVATKWLVVRRWNEQHRYAHGKAEPEARSLYEAITDPADGVLPWIKGRW